MKKINTYITEKLKIRKSSYKYFPKTKKELKDILRELIKERGNEGDFNDIDTSKITDMSELFNFMENFNGDISKWDVSNVTSMERMFYWCESFNQDISNWDVSNVNNMKLMFCNCQSFNQDISEWDVSNVTDIESMFTHCSIEEKYKPKFK